MSAPILVLVDRLMELSELLLAMTKEYDMKKFLELDRRFQEVRKINEIEDKLNEATI